MKPFSTGLLAVFACLTAACHATTSPLGKEAFDLSAYEQFSDSGSPWSSTDTSLNADGLGIQSVLIRKNASFADGWIEVATDHADDGGVVLHFRDNEHYYLLAIRDDASPFPRDTENLQIYERNGAGAAGFKPLWLMNIDWPRGASHHVRFEARGDLLIVSFDGAIVGSVRRRAPFNGSGFGPRHYGAGANWHARFTDILWRGI